MKTFLFLFFLFFALNLGAEEGGLAIGTNLKATTIKQVKPSRFLIPERTTAEMEFFAENEVNKNITVLVCVEIPLDRYGITSFKTGVETPLLFNQENILSCSFIVGYCRITAEGNDDGFPKLFFGNADLIELRLKYSRKIGEGAFAELFLSYEPSIEPVRGVTGEPKSHTENLYLDILSLGFSLRF